MVELILIAVAIAGFILLALWRLDLAVVTTIVLLPTYLIRFDINGIPFTLLESFVICLAVVFFFQKKLYRFSYLKHIVDRVPFKLATLVFFAAASVAVLVSPQTRVALGEWRAYFLEAIVFYIIFVNVIRTRRQVRWVFYALGISVLAVSVYALWQQFTGYGIPDPWGEAELRRVTAWYGYPVAVALYLAPLVSLFFSQLIFYKKSPVAPRWQFSLAVVILGTTAVFFTHSRGALVAIILALAILSFFTRYRWWVLAAVVGAIVILAVIPGVSDRFLDVFQGNDNSTNVRLVMWQGTWKLILDHWLLGAGLGGFPALYDVYREARHTELLLYPHNLILNFWVEIGLVGLTAFVWIIVSCFQKIYQGLKSGREKSLLAGVLAALVALLVHGLIDVPYFKNDLAILFWIIVGLLAITFSFLKNKNVNKKNVLV